MAYDPTPEDDATALKARRAVLRAFVEDIAERVAQLPLPETYLEAERGARAVWVADRAVVRMRPETLGGEGEAAVAPTTATWAQAPFVRSPSPAGEEYPRRHPAQDAPSATSPKEEVLNTVNALVTPVRLRLRKYADRLMEVVDFIPKPECYLEGERAGRYALMADRMLTQLYEAPKPAQASGDKWADDDMDAQSAEAPESRGFFKKIDNCTSFYARSCGFWPDGSRCDPDAPDDQAAMEAVDLDVFDRFKDGNPVDPMRIFAEIMTLRVNAITNAQAKDSGQWPDGTPWADDDPDYYRISSAFDTAMEQKEPKNRLTGEGDGPQGFPWWLVKALSP